MQAWVVERFGPAVAAAAAGAFGAPVGSLRDLGGFESFVYEATIDGRPAVLKIGHSGRRTPGQLEAEAAFTRYLAERGVSVSSALRTGDGALVAPIDDGHGAWFLATAWTRAPGVAPPSPPTDLGYWTAQGALIGAIHRSTRTYAPAGEARPAWDDPGPLADTLHLPEGDPACARRDALLAARRALPRDPDSYGLVHQDAHQHNVRVDGGRVTLFDFDDCGATWFADDLAIVMYYGLLPQPDPAAAAAAIWPAFLRGYARHHAVDPAWFAHVPAFLAWRDHLLASVVHRSRGTLPDGHADAWLARFAARYADERPIVDYDFVGAAERVFG